MNNYLYIDAISRKHFYVLANSRKEAAAIANQYFPRRKFLCMDTPEWAAKRGYDVYTK
jgi:hypothetical protein